MDLAKLLGGPGRGPIYGMPVEWGNPPPAGPSLGMGMGGGIAGGLGGMLGGGIAGGGGAPQPPVSAPPTSLPPLGGMGAPLGPPTFAAGGQPQELPPMSTGYPSRAPGAPPNINSAALGPNALLSQSMMEGHRPSSLPSPGTEAYRQWEQTPPGSPFSLLPNQNTALAGSASPGKMPTQGDSMPPPPASPEAAPDLFKKTSGRGGFMGLLDSLGWGQLPPQRVTQGDAFGPSPTNPFTDEVIGNAPQAPGRSPMRSGPGGYTPMVNVAANGRLALPSMGEGMGRAEPAFQRTIGQAATGKERPMDVREVARGNLYHLWNDIKAGKHATANPFQGSGMNPDPLLPGGEAGRIREAALSFGPKEGGASLKSMNDVAERKLEGGMRESQLRQNPALSDEIKMQQALTQRMAELKGERPAPIDRGADDAAVAKARAFASSEQAKRDARGPRDLGDPQKAQQVRMARQAVEAGRAANARQLSASRRGVFQPMNGDDAQLFSMMRMGVPPQAALAFLAQAKNAQAQAGLENSRMQLLNQNAQADRQNRLDVENLRQGGKGDDKLDWGKVKAKAILEGADAATIARIDEEIAKAGGGSAPTQPGPNLLPGVTTESRGGYKPATPQQASVAKRVKPHEGRSNAIVKALGDSPELPMALDEYGGTKDRTWPQYFESWMPWYWGQSQKVPIGMYPDGGMRDTSRRPESYEIARRQAEKAARIGDPDAAKLAAFAESLRPK